MYAGKKKYNAPKSFWNLFDNPALAKESMGDEYKLIDLERVPNEEIRQKQHLGMLEYFLKNIHESDIMKLWESFFEDFIDMLILDKKLGYIYIKKLLWYTNKKMDEKDKEALDRKSVV